MKIKESRAVISLGAIMSFRMLGLFMILPVFSVYLHKMPDATPTLIGVALGIYGLTQACLQIPFGSLSDKIGRKKIILLGLVLFTIGSVIAALSHSIGGIILGRAIQGGGAIGSTVLALVADLTRDESRNKAMAFVGLSIGLSFMIAMIVGPIVNHWFQLSGIFWLTALLAIIGIILLYTAVPKPPALFIDSSAEPVSSRFKHVLTNPQLIKLDLSIGLQHAIFTALFLAMPVVLTHDLNLSSQQQIWLYLGVLVLAFISMVPFIIIAEKKRLMRPIFISAIALIALCQLVFWLGNHHTILVMLGLFVFFTAFTFLESCLPSLVSKQAPIRQKGSAMGVYSSSQFFGIFIGGAVGGVCYGHFGLSGVFAFALGLAVIWWLISLSFQNPPYLSTVTIPYKQLTSSEISSIQQVNGVQEVAWFQGEQLLIVKIDKQKISEQELRNTLETGSLDH